MRRLTLSGLFGMALLITLAAPAGAQSQITEQEAHAIGVKAQACRPLQAVEGRHSGGGGPGAQPRHRSHDVGRHDPSPIGYGRRSITWRPCSQRRRPIGQRFAVLILKKYTHSAPAAAATGAPQAAFARSG